jgi:chromosome segregation ATPase
MTWKEALVMLLLGAVVGVAGMVWYMQSEDSKWTEREKELVEDSARFQRLAKVHGDSADEAIVKANAAEREASKAIAELEAYKKRRRGRPMPTNLKDCKEELGEYSAEAAVAERALAYTRVTNDHLRVTVSEQRGQILALGSALTAEHERGDGWKRHSRRARVKQAFFGIGMAGAGVLIGYGGATVAMR